MRSVLFRVGVLLVCVAAPAFVLGVHFERSRHRDRTQDYLRSDSGAQEPSGRSTAPATHEVDRSSTPPVTSPPESGTASESGDPEVASEEESLKPGPAMLVASEVAFIRKLYARLGPQGLTPVMLQGLMKQLETEEGRASLLREIELEESPHFLRALLGQLAARSGDLGDALIDPVFSNVLWSEFTVAQDAVKRDALLEFFIREPRLRSRHMDDIITIATGGDASASDDLKNRAIAGLRSSIGDPKVQQAVLDVVQSARSAKVKAAAVFALSDAPSAEARAAIRESMRDESESVRHAAVSVYRPQPGTPEQKQFHTYLKDELKSGESRVYRCALLDRLMDFSRKEALQVVDRELGATSDSTGRAYFEQLRQMLSEPSTSLHEVRKHTSALRYKYQFRH